MFLYLIQHGEAKPEEEDPERGLTDQGFREIAKTALFAKERGIRPGSIHHSGKKRAHQTAQTLVDYLRPEKGLSAADGLAPLDAPAIWAGRLSSTDEDVMLVGHLPHLSRLASQLLCGDPDKQIIGFQMAGLLCLERSGDGRWTVAWMVVPRLIA